MSRGSGYSTLFDDSFLAALDSLWVLFTSVFLLNREGMAVCFNTRLCCTANPKRSFKSGVVLKQSSAKCSLHRTEDGVGCHLSRILCTCFAHKCRNLWSFGKRKSVIRSLGQLEQPAATQRFGIANRRLQITLVNSNKTASNRAKQPAVRHLTGQVTARSSLRVRHFRVMAFGPNDIWRVVQLCDLSTKSIKIRSISALYITMQPANIRGMWWYFRNN